MDATNTAAVTACTKTHDGQTVYPAGYPLPAWAHGWVQCDNRGAGYATWLDAADQAQSRADSARIAAESKKLRTRAQCEAALIELGIQPGGSCASMRLMYEIVSYRDLWPLRQVAK